MWYTCFGDIETEEQIYRFNDKGGSRMRPFSESAQLKHHGYSRALQRVVCDFGADHAFGQVNKKLHEHYKIELPSSAARRITEHHAEQMSLREYLEKAKKTPADFVIGECDGSMIPIVEAYVPEEEQATSDRRKHKRLFWKEARLSLAHAKGSASPCFAGTMESVEVAGEQLLSCVRQAGAHTHSRIHCVGDGARWIANQVEEQFGANGTYLIDFYHLCEYLSSAAKSCAPHGHQKWLNEQKAQMKSSCHVEVLHALFPHLEPQEAPDNEAPVRVCYRYIKNRPEQLDYKSAQEQELPIGSGEIESAHRYVLQSRLKLAGAWWAIENAKDMINLRVCRANDNWDNYWKMGVCN